jgi:hypothetical protein
MKREAGTGSIFQGSNKIVQQPEDIYADMIEEDAQAAVEVEETFQYQRNDSADLGLSRRVM